jgi:hypothetical protein
LPRVPGWHSKKKEEEKKLEKLEKFAATGQQGQPAAGQVSLTNILPGQA